MKKYFNFFINFVELRTKVASVFPYLFAVLFYLYHFKDDNGVRILNFALFVVSMLLLDMSTTAINHIYGIKKESDRSQYDQRLVDEMEQIGFNINNAIRLIIFMLIVSATLGIILVYLSNIGVLLLGMLCFLIGITYSYGYKPISTTPFGELFAGGTMGVILPVIVIFSQYQWLPFELNPTLIVAFMPFAFFIGNILFANNICDLKQDRINQRFTLAHYVTTNQAILMLRLSQLGAFTFILLAIYLDYLPLIFISTSALLPHYHKNITLFAHKMQKATSFGLIVKNFIHFSILYVLLMLLSIILY